MTETATPTTAATPKVGFVSLGALSALHLNPSGHP
jgi:hypothetical protein